MCKDDNSDQQNSFSLLISNDGPNRVIAVTRISSVSTNYLKTNILGKYNPWLQYAPSNTLILKGIFVYNIGWERPQLRLFSIVFM